MSARAEGKRLLDKLGAYQDKFDEGQSLLTVEGDGEHTRFPARYIHGDPYDDVAKIKGQLASAGRPAPVTDQDVTAILDKHSAFEAIKFEDWFQNQYPTDSTDPNKQRWAQQMVPEFYRKREEVIDQMAEIQKQLAKMRLYGIRSREDLDLLYALDKGTIEVPNTAIWNLKGRELNDPKRGPFNPKRHNESRLNGRYKSGTPVGNYGIGDQLGEDRMPPMDRGINRGFAGYRPNDVQWP